MSVVFHVLSLDKHQRITELTVSNYDDKWYAGVDLNVDDIPPDTDTIRFYIAWERITIMSATKVLSEGYWFYSDNLNKNRDLVMGDLASSNYYYG